MRAMECSARWGQHERPWTRRRQLSSASGLPLVCREFVAQMMIRWAMDDDQETMIRRGVQRGHTVNARGRAVCMRMCKHVWRLTLMIADSIRSWWRAASAGRDEAAPRECASPRGC